ncbi:MAG: hypothetical protein HOV68_19315 [Streptomycetaceae bacterium]|nr:hypothetical protein [Streptomycetaceae bacterium]
MTTDLDKAWELVEAGDVSAVMRHLRTAADRLETGDLARIVEKAADMVDFDDLAQAAARLAGEPDVPQHLYDFGYACLEHGASYAAIPALAEALRRVPDSRAVLGELVAAYEREERHSDAVAALERRGAALEDWPERYLLVYNAVMAGDLTRARRHAARLGAPGDEQWEWAYGRVRSMLARADAVGPVRPLDHEDLRGWHFVLTGGVLATISPYGYRQGMLGRYAFHQDSHATCREGLDRLARVLDAAGAAPTTVSVLNDRGSRILSRAAADVLGLPTVPFDPDRADTLVVAYQLGDVPEDELRALIDRAPGQILFEHATCWTDPPMVPADITTLLRQVGKAPWDKQLTADPDGGAEDLRPDEEIAADIVAAAPGSGPDGDLDAPTDTEADLTAFTEAIAPLWAKGSRDQPRSAGPVRSSRFG